jgi:hypothetical protein
MSPFLDALHGVEARVKGNGTVSDGRASGTVPAFDVDRANAQVQRLTDFLGRLLSARTGSHILNGLSAAERSRSRSVGEPFRCCQVLSTRQHAHHPLAEVAELADALASGASKPKHRSQPTPENRGRLSHSTVVHSRPKPRFLESVAQRCTQECSDSIADRAHQLAGAHVEGC